MNKKSVLLVLLLTLFAKGYAFQKPAIKTLNSDTGGWTASISTNGSITEIAMPFNDKKVRIPWRTGSLAGPAWKGVAMHPVNGNQLLFKGRKGNQVYSLQYRDVNGKLTIIAGLQNESSKPFLADPAVRLILGINNEMKDPKTYFGVFFPTLLRCEKTHFWGYFQNPNGQILTITSPDAIASRQIGYISQGHRIATSSLDVLHALPLPERHPQNSEKLAPGESRSWEIVLQPVDSLNEVLPVVAANCKAPAIGIDRTTAAPGETIEMSVYPGSDDHPVLTIFDPKGNKINIPDPEMKNNRIRYTLKAPEKIGNYKVEVVENGKKSEAIFHVRKPWGWYLKHAREEALRMQIKPMSHREGWLGFFSAYDAQTYFPNQKLLNKTGKVFDNFYKLMVDSTKTDFYHDKPTWSERPQNTSWMVGMMTARYAATKKIEDLEEANKWGVHFIEKFQLPNGAYKGYTALTLGAKFLRQLAYYERPLAKKYPKWKKRYDRLMLSVKRASRNLLEVKDLGDTEGQSTYEDSQAGSTWSLLAMHALNTKDKQLRKEFLKTSLQVQARHLCLTQALIPDGRMRNATLRFWEAQYDILTLPNMMNSPHGWTMRSQFGAFYLYLLTGKERFLNIMNNAMGACVQAINEKNGILRWSFIPDPYVEVKQFVPDPKHPGQGKHVSKVIGEQWLPMISSWWRVPKGELGALTKWTPEGFQGVSQGWSCDNDVHQTFRVLSEEFVPNAFVLERDDGSLRTMNCQVKREGNVLYVHLPEAVVSRVNFNLKKKYKVVVPFALETIEKTVKKGMHWVGPGGIPKLFR